MLKSWFAALAIAGVVIRMRKHQINDELASDNASTLQVVNHHWGDVDIYVIRDGQRTRVGQVTASADENFVLSKSMIERGGTLQLQAHAVGTSGRSTARRSPCGRAACSSRGRSRTTCRERRWRSTRGSGGLTYLVPPPPPLLWPPPFPPPTPASLRVASATTNAPPSSRDFDLLTRRASTVPSE